MARKGFSGWSAVGYALGGGFERDRKKEAQQAELALRKAGYKTDETGNIQTVEGSEQAFREEAFNVMANRLQELENEKTQSDTWNVLNEAVENGDWENANRFINSPKNKELFNSLGIQSYESFDPNNPNHKKILSNAGVNPDFVKALDAVKEDGVITPEELGAIQKAYPIVRKTDGTIDLDSVENMVAMTGMAKSTANRQAYENMLDVIAQGKQAFAGVGAKLYNARVRGAEAQATKVEAEAGTKLAQLEDMQNWLEANPNKTIGDYKAIQAVRETEARGEANLNVEQERTRRELGKASEKGTTAYEKKVKYISNITGKSEANVIKGLEDKATSKRLQLEKFEDDKLNKILENSPTGEMYDVDYNALDKDNKREFNQLITEEIKNLSTKDEERINSFHGIRDASAKINVDELDKVTGIVDASFSTLLDTLGIDRADVDVENETQMAVIRNVFVKAMSGSQVTGNEWTRLKDQLGTNFKADRTASLKLGNAMQEAISSLTAIRDKAPAYYAKNLKSGVDNLGRIASELKGFEGTTTTRPKVRVGAIVKDSQGNRYRIDENGTPQRIQ